MSLRFAPQGLYQTTIPNSKAMFQRPPSGKIVQGPPGPKGSLKSTRDPRNTPFTPRLSTRTGMLLVPDDVMQIENIFFSKLSTESCD